MGIALYESLDDMQTLINANWSIGSMPIITKSYEQKAVGFVDARRNIILITPEMKIFNINYAKKHNIF